MTKPANITTLEQYLDILPVLDTLILNTPTGATRNHLTDAAMTAREMIDALTRCEYVLNRHSDTRPSLDYTAAARQLHTCSTYPHY